MLRSTPLLWTAIFMALNCFSFTLSSQTNDGLALLEKGDFSSAHTAFMQQLGEKKNRIAGDYGLALLYFNPEYNGYKLEKAYEHINNASEAIKDINDRTKDDLKSMGVTSREIRQLKTDILAKAVAVAEDEGTEESFNYLLDNYKLKYDEKNIMMAKRDSVVYEAAREKGSFTAYKTTLEKYEKTMRRTSPTVYNLIQLDLYQSYIKENGQDKFDAFKEMYRDNPYVRDIGASDYMRIKDSQSSAQFKSFIQKYPNSLYRPYAEESILELRLKELSAKIKSNAPGRIAYLSLLDLLKPELDTRNWSEALELSKRFEADFGDYQHYRELVQMLAEPEKELEIKSFGPGVNSKGKEYSPAISADGKTLFFCGSGRPNNLGSKEDIFVSRLKDGVWSEAELVKSLCSPNKNEAPQNVTADGNRLIIFNSGKLAYSNKTATGWSGVVNFSDTINAKNWQSDGIITADGRAFLYAAHASGGTNDIMVSLKQGDGNWGVPFSLGEKVNTPYDERDPFLHPDMRTLYFSSSGRGGFGNLDVFVTTRLDDSWTNWSEPVNLGKELNTTNRDWGYKITTDGKRAVFAATFEGEDENLYEVLLPEELRPDPVTTVEGNVKGLNKEESAVITVRDAITGGLIGEFTTEPGTGNYFLVLPSGVEPIVTIDKKGVISTTQKLELDIQEDGSAKVVKDLEVKDLTNLKAGDAFSISFEDLLFDTDKSEIKPAFYKDLDDLAENIKATDLEVSIEGHTDNVGGDEYNVDLSNRRANAVRDYLLGKGCDPEKVTAQGYGEAKPVSGNDTDEGRAKNRRVEVKFSKKK